MAAPNNQDDIKREKLRQSNIVEFAAHAVSESIKYKDKPIFKALNAKNYVAVKATTTGEENLVNTFFPYLDKDGTQYSSQVPFGSNTITEWSYFFLSDRDPSTGEVPEAKIKWLPISADDFKNMKAITAKSFDTVIAMLGACMSSTLETNKDNFAGYQETLISIGAFKEASNYAVEKGYKALPEADFEEQALATSVFAAIMSYMIAVAKDNTTNDNSDIVEMPFLGVSDYYSNKTTNSALYKGMSQFRTEKSMLTSLWQQAKTKK